jgi:hypothetical protein
LPYRRSATCASTNAFISSGREMFIVVMDDTLTRNGKLCHRLDCACHRGRFDRVPDHQCTVRALLPRNMGPKWPPASRDRSIDLAQSANLCNHRPAHRR